jgi:hypothetical protein
MFCGIGLLAGSGVWLWATRALLFITTVCALVFFVRSGHSPVTLVMFDAVWTMPHWPARVAAVLFAPLGVWGMVMIGRRTVRAGRSRVHTAA